MTGKPEASPSTIGDARRLQIVQAAREICLDIGFSKSTISDIAERVGMTRSLFYHYFQDKDQVAGAVLDDVISEVFARLEVWNEHREAGYISKALDDVVRLTRSLIADEGLDAEEVAGIFKAFRSGPVRLEDALLHPFSMKVAVGEPVEGLHPCVVVIQPDFQGINSLR